MLAEIEAVDALGKERKSTAVSLVRDGKLTLEFSRTQGGPDDGDRARCLERVFDRITDLTKGSKHGLALRRLLKYENHDFHRALELLQKIYRRTGKSPVEQAWLHLVQTALFSEAFHPSVGQAFPAFGSPLGGGHIGRAQLAGPLAVAGPLAKVQDALHDVDLVAPLTAVPCGPLRTNCSSWVGERFFHAFFTLPFVLAHVPDSWNWETIHKELGGESLLLYVPDEKSLTLDWKEIRASRKSTGATALWHFQSGKVLWKEGLTSRADLMAKGKELIQRT
jgi:hypothetical protein